MINNKSEWAEMGSNGKEYLLKNLTWEIIGRKALETYEELLQNND
jgi:glycosyltransferase involved in cell wall biosynthesis